MKMKYMISIILGLVFWMGCSDDENLSLMCLNTR